MIEFLIEALLELLWILGLRKKKPKEAESTLPVPYGSPPKQDIAKAITRDGVPVCAGCSRRLKIGAVYEIGKSWCTDCYKAHVLKIKGSG